MRYPKILILFFLFLNFFLGTVLAGETGEELFSGLDSKGRFAEEISFLIEKAWKNWQDSVMVNDINVEGSAGILLPGDLSGPVLTASSILASFDGKGRSQEYISCVRVVAGALENGMRSWQRGYTHTNIPFPQGASCVITLPPCNNVPVTIGTGHSSGDEAMTENALYSYMIYRTPRQEEDVLIVFRGTAKAIAECFNKWKNSCFIVGIMASGGIASHPAPMGTGPGPVKAAKGKNGRLAGPYLGGEKMCARMIEYFSAQDAEQL